MRLNPLIIVLGIIATGLVMLLINHDSGQTLGLKNDDFANLIYLLPLATLLGAGVLASREKLGQNLRFLGIWTLIGLVLITAYVYKDDGRNIASRVMAAIVPGETFTLTTSEGRQEVVLRKQRSGHFTINAEINGQSLPMLVDTGATQIALTFDDARRIGLDPSNLNFNREIMTANGVAMAATARIRQIVVGPIVRKNITVSIAERGRLGESLLGMNFLSTLSSIRIEPNEMRLTD